MCAFYLTPGGHAIGTYTQNHSTTSPIRVLLAEDNRGDVYLVREAFNEHNLRCELTVLSDGEQAERYIEQIIELDHFPCPDLFLLDLNLPKGDGHELLRRFRSIAKCKIAPIVVITSSDSPRDRMRATELGATSYFRKPSNLDDFLKLGAVIRQVLNREKDTN